MNVNNKNRKAKDKKYYCDGICERCDKGKYYHDEYSRYYTCDPEKIKGLHIIAPAPPGL